MPGEGRLNSSGQKRYDRRSAAALAVSRRVESPLQPLSPAERAELLAACEANKLARFGVVRLAGKCLDEAVVDGRTLMRHAAALHRHAIVASLLRAGADATACACRRQKAEALAPCGRALAACRRLGDSRAQRSTQLVTAVKSGRLLRVAALLRAGCDVETLDEDGSSGGTPLFLAAWRGRAAVVDLLLAAGARADVCDYAGVSAAEAAHAAGYHDLARTLAVASGGGPPRPPIVMPPPLSPAEPRLTLCLPDCEESHPGAGAAYLDDAFSEAWLCELERLFSRLPPIAPAKPGGSTRSNFVDAPGWVCAGLAAALAAVRDTSPAGCAMRTCSGCLPQLRFLSYAEAGSRLSPHVDLPKHRACDGAASTHTFILYLRGGEGGGGGGETRLLRSASHPWPEEEGGDPPLASVAPRRGRLLLFPHACPHDGAEVTAPPKLLLRGEML